MYCSHCGHQMKETDKFCPSCGAPAAQEERPQSDPWNQTQNIPANQPAQAQEPTMKWFKFMIYFATFAAALVWLSNGLKLLTGSVYGEDAGLVYVMFPSLRYLDLPIGVVSLGMAAFWIYIRFRLAQFRANGPKLLIIAYVASIVINLIYGIGAAAILAGSLGAEAVPMNVIVYSAFFSGCMIFFQKTYFKKRAALFVN